MPARRGILRRRGVQTPKLTRSGANLQVAGSAVRLAGMNAYWLGLDDNQGASAPGAFPTQTQLTAAFTGMREMGANLARAHTVGMSAGTSKSFETAAGTFVDANLLAADYAVYQAKLKGIYLMCPLTDNWNYYHGGKWNFVHWAYQQNSSGITDTPGTTKDDVNERIFFANSAAGLRVRQLFKDYITAWLNHFNPYTGLRYKDDPTIAIVETGNEIYYASQLGSNEWTQDIASFIKGIAPDKLVADGSAADRVFVANSPGLTAAAVDIVGAHYYPQQQSGSYPPVQFADTTSGYTAGSALQQLSADATNAFNAGKPFLVGEFPWTRSDVSSFYSAVSGNAKVSGAMPWAYIGNTDAGVALTHGGAFGTDDFSIHRPYANSSEQTYAPALASLISAVSGVATSNGAGTAPANAPETVSGLVHRLRVGALGLTTGTAVQTVALQTGGLTLSQATAASRPTYFTGGLGGKSALRFDGGDDWMDTTATLTTGQPFTAAFFLDVKNATGVRQFGYGAGGSVDFSINDGAVGYSLYAGTYVTPAGTPTIGGKLVIWIYNGANSQVIVNNAIVNSGDTSTGGLTSTLTLGRHPTQSRYAQMDLYELDIYSKVLSTSELQTLFDYYNTNFV